MKNKNGKIPQEVLDYFGKYFWFDKSKLTIDKSDGLWIYDGYMDFSDTVEDLDDLDILEFPEWFRNFKEISGSFDCSYTYIESLEVLENLQKVGGNFDCSATHIINFKGLENLRTIGLGLDCYSTPLESFEGLGNLQKIGGYLDFSDCNNLETFDGINPLVNIEGDGGYKIYPEERTSEFLEWKKSKRIQEISKLLECI